MGWGNVLRGCYELAAKGLLSRACERKHEGVDLARPHPDRSTRFYGRQDRFITRSQFAAGGLHS